MGWLQIHLAWKRITDGDGLEAKKSALIDCVEPLADHVEEEVDVEAWMHSFHGSNEMLDTPRIQFVLMLSDDVDAAAEAVRDFCDQEGLDEDVEYVIEDDYYPETMEEFWGNENLKKWARKKGLSSTLAIEAFKGNLGKNFEWHRQQNRPGHIWLNQLGCRAIEEAVINQKEAAFRLSLVDKSQQSDEVRERLEQAEDNMEEAFELLSPFYQERGED